MTEPSNHDKTRRALREQILGVGERTLRKGTAVDQQRQIDTLRRALATLQEAHRNAEESEAYYRELFDKASEAIIVHDRADAIYAVNHAFCELYGYSREEAQQLSIWDVSAPAMRESDVALERADWLASGQDVWRFEWLCQKKNGEQFWTAVTLRGTTIRGLTRVMATVRDISGRKRVDEALDHAGRTSAKEAEQRSRELDAAYAEQLRLLEHLQRIQQRLRHSERLASLGALVAGITHELGTPVGNSLVVANTLEAHLAVFGAELEHEVRRSTLMRFVGEMGVGVHSLVRNLQRVADLVGSFTELAIDHMSSRRRKFELREVIHEIQLTFSPRLSKARCVLHNQIAPGIELDSYPGPFDRVIGCLIDNAIQHGFAQRTFGEISLIIEDCSDDWVKLVVSDNGNGIDPHILPKVFDPFFSNRAERDDDSLGLGVAYNIVTGMLGGTMQVRSELGQGTEVTLNLPRTAPFLAKDSLDAIEQASAASAAHYPPNADKKSA